jgi:hypothetical protein
LTSSQTLASPNQGVGGELLRVARFPNLRALAWSGDVLYASRGYELVRANVADATQPLDWQSVARFRPGWKRALSNSSRLSARLFRDGFHALCLLQSGGIVAAVPGAILTLTNNEKEFRLTHKITRGTRPLHIAAVPSGVVYWGEYFDNGARDEVHIYGSSDGGVTWSVAYTFPKGAVRHVHNIVHDPWEKCLWVLTGDNGKECRILRASYDFKIVDLVLQGNQQARAVAAVPSEDGVYFSSDTPLEPNFIYRLDRNRKLSQLASITSSSIYGCRVGQHLFFSTMVEPSEVNRDRSVRIYAGHATADVRWKPVLAFAKDRWPMGLFQYGNAFVPDGNNTSQYLALTTVAVQAEDMVTSIYTIAVR